MAAIGPKLPSITNTTRSCESVGTIAGERAATAAASASVARRGRGVPMGWRALCCGTFRGASRMSPDDHAFAPNSKVGRARAKNIESGVTIVPSVCPHDCTSTCALDVERLDAKRIGRVRGSLRNDYTAGVICEKVARYAERIHHPDRLMKPLRRIGPKGSRQFAEISWADALDIVAEQFIAKARQHGNETVWPYYYAGTMGLVQRA